MQVLNGLPRVESLMLASTNTKISTKHTKFEIVDLRLLEHATRHLADANEANVTEKLASTANCVQELIQQHDEVDSKLASLVQLYKELKDRGDAIDEHRRTPVKPAAFGQAQAEHHRLATLYLEYWQCDNELRNQLFELIKPPTALFSEFCNGLDLVASSNQCLLPPDRHLAQWLVYLQSFCKRTEKEVRMIMDKANRRFEEFLRYDPMSKSVCDAVYERHKYPHKTVYQWRNEVVERVQLHFIMYKCRWVAKDYHWTTGYISKTENQQQRRNQAPSNRFSENNQNAENWTDYFPLYHKERTWYGEEGVGEVSCSRSSRWALRWQIPSIKHRISNIPAVGSAEEVHVINNYNLDSPDVIASSATDPRGVLQPWSKKRKHDSASEEENVPRKKQSTLDHSKPGSSLPLASLASTAGPQHSAIVGTKPIVQPPSSSPAEAERQQIIADHLHHTIDASSIWSTAHGLSKDLVTKSEVHMHMPDVDITTADGAKILTFEGFRDLLAPHERDAILRDPKTPLYSEFKKAYTAFVHKDDLADTGATKTKVAQDSKTVSTASAITPSVGATPSVLSPKSLSGGVLYSEVHHLNGDRYCGTNALASASKVGAEISNSSSIGQEGALIAMHASNSISASAGRKRKSMHTPESPNDAPIKFSKLASGAKQAQHGLTETVKLMTTNSPPEIDMETKIPRKFRQPRSRKLPCGCFLRFCICPGNKAGPATSLDSPDSGYESFDSPAASSEDITDTSDIDSPSANSYLSSPSLGRYPAGSFNEGMAAPLDTTPSRILEEDEEEEEL